MGKSLEHEAEQVVPLALPEAEKEKSKKTEPEETKLRFPKGATSLEVEEGQILSREPLPGTGKRGKMGKANPKPEFEKAEFKTSP